MADAVACPICRGESTRPWFEKGGYAHRYCTACQFGFVHPVPDSAEIDAYYGALDSGLSSDCSWATEPRHKLEFWRGLLKRVVRLSGHGPLLDLGCGGGQFLRLAREVGWNDLAGIELSEKAAALARAAVDAPIHVGSWAEIDVGQGLFAAVSLLDVLEHARDPAALLQYVHRCLRPGGSVVISVPNTKGLSIRGFGRNARVVIPPEHLSYFTRVSLANLLHREGFAVAWQSTCDLYLKEWLRFLPRVSGGKPSAPAADTRRADYARWYRRLTGSTALRAIGAVNHGLAATGLGDQLVCVARKPP